jgi:hypothetical protein
MNTRWRKFQPEFAIQINSGVIRNRNGSASTPVSRRCAPSNSRRLREIGRTFSFQQSKITLV